VNEQKRKKLNGDEKNAELFSHGRKGRTSLFPTEDVRHCTGFYGVYIFNKGTVRT
jgi:hypothetical protein